MSSVNHSFIQMTKLSDVKGRIRYISDPKRQENLYATYGNVSKKHWQQLAKQNHRDFEESGTKGSCIEARELILMLPPSLITYDHDDLLKYLTEIFSMKYKVGCQAALHHNHTKTNLHIHLIFSERKILDEPEIKIATRNRFYNEQGKHVRTKKEILDEEGNIRSRCSIIKKGEVYETNLFDIKDPAFKSEEFLQEVKEMYTGIFNRMSKDEKEKLTLFQRNGPYLATKKIGKNNPKADVIKADNLLKKEWNNMVDRGLISGISEENLLKEKTRQITEPVAKSIKENGNQPGKFTWILQKAIGMLRGMVEYAMKTQEMEKDEKGRPLIYKEFFVDVTPASRPAEGKTPCPSIEREKIEVLRLESIDQKLQKKNKMIYAIEKNLKAQKKELSNTSGWMWNWSKIDRLKNEISSNEMKLTQAKSSLEVIPAQHGFVNVAEFKRAYNLAKKKLSEAEERQKQWKKENEEQKPVKQKVEANAVREKVSISKRLEQNKEQVGREIKKEKSRERECL